MKKVILIVCSFSQIYSINLRLLDGTTSVLSQDNLLEYAPFRGVPFAEGLAENLYNFSYKNISSEISAHIKESKHTGQDIENSKKSVQSYLESMQKLESATSKLVSIMFHRSGGQFQLTEALNNPVSKFTPKDIGGIFKIILNSSSNLQSELESYLGQLKYKKPSGSFFVAKDFRPFVTSLVGSLAECNKSNPKALYAPGTTTGILLGYVLRRSNTKADLEAYIEGLTGKKITLPEHQEYSDKDIKEIIQAGIKLDGTKAFGDWLTCAFFKKNYQSVLPKITANKHVEYDGTSFSDCVETTIRNLCNIATYNGFNLGVSPEGVQLSSVLQNFYAQEKSKLPSEVGNQEVHQAWTNAIENMPSIAYHRIKISGSKEDSLYLPAEYEGFMPVDNSLMSDDELAKLPQKEITVGKKNFMLREKVVGDAKYLLVPQDSDLSCYEVMPTASNMVVALNTLFNLKLYNPQAMFDTNFAQENFSKVCDKLGWKLETPRIDNTKGGTIQVGKGESTFAINLHHKAHGYVSVLKDRVGNYVDKNIIAQDSYQQHPEEISELLMIMDASVTMQDLFDAAGKDIQVFLKLLRNVDVRNTDRRAEVIIQVLKLQLQNVELDRDLGRMIVSLSTHDVHYVTSIANNCENVSDTIKTSLKLALDIQIIQNESGRVFDLSVALAKVNILTVKEIMSLLEKGIASTQFGVAETALSTMAALAKAGMLTAQEIMPLLEKGIASTQFYVAETALSTMADLAKAGILTVEEIMPLLKKGIASTQLYVPQKALSTMADLAKAGILTVEEIMPLLKKGIESTQYDVAEKALSIIADLVKAKILTVVDAKKLTDQKIIPLLEKGIASTVYSVPQETLSTMANLAKAGILTVEEIMPLLEKGIVSTQFYVAEKALSTMADLAKAGILTVEEIMPLLEKGIANTQSYVPQKALSTMADLAKAGILTVEEIMQLLKQGIESSDSNVSRFVFDATVALVKAKILTGADEEQLSQEMNFDKEDHLNKVKDFLTKKSQAIRAEKEHRLAEQRHSELEIQDEAKNRAEQYSDELHAI